jgi:hypothetical protein
VLVVILDDVLRVPFFVLSVVSCVHHVLAAHLVVDVAMVSSPLVGRGYRNASMLDS